MIAGVFLYLSYTELMQFQLLKERSDLHHGHLHGVVVKGICAVNLTVQ